MPPENVRKPKVFWRFQGVKERNISLKWVEHFYDKFLKVFVSESNFVGKKCRPKNISDRFEWKGGRKSYY